MGFDLMKKNKELKKSSERIFFLMDLIIKHKSMRFSEIQNLSGIPKSSLYGLMNELIDLQVVSYDKSTKNYSIGPEFIQLCYKCIANIDLLDTIDVACAKLSNTIGGTVHAGMLSNTDVTYISKHEGEDKISIINNKGMTLPAHATAVGKALLSGYSDEELRQLYHGKELQQYTPNTITSIDKLIEEISEVRKLGYSKEHGEISLLAACVGIPIIQNKKVITAISVTIPISKFTEEYQQYIVNLLKETKSELESIINI